MHRILLREVVIDSPSSTLAATRDFWAAALQAEPRGVSSAPEFSSLHGAASLPWVGLQDTGSGPARVHLDIETDDVEAEVRRLTGLGAILVAEMRTWVVLRDPAGLLFCVTRVESPQFDERARSVE